MSMQRRRKDSFSIFPPGLRRDDPNSSKLFRMALQVRRANPILVAFTVALAVCAIPFIMVLGQQGTLREQDRAIQTQRAEAVRLLCAQNEVLVNLVSPPVDPTAKDDLRTLEDADCPQLLKVIRDTTTTRER